MYRIAKLLVAFMLFSLVLPSYAAIGKKGGTDNTFKQGTNIEASHKDMAVIINQLRLNIENLSAENERLKNRLENITDSRDMFEIELEHVKQNIHGLAESKRSYEDFEKYGDSIGLTAILVGLMALILTALAIITGLSFYKGHKAFERHKDNLIEKARWDVRNEVLKYLENQVQPMVQDKIRSQETRFWQRTYIGRLMENEYWILLLSVVKDRQKRLDLHNKFKLAIAKILAEEDLVEGIAYLSHLRMDELPRSLEKSLYKLYGQGLFTKYEEQFAYFIQNLYHMELVPWLDRIKDILKRDESYIDIDGK